MIKKNPPEKASDIVVFKIISDAVYAECGEELGSGRLLRLEAERPLCMGCADLSHLVFLPSGDAALTQRASKYSKLRAIVLRFSRRRKRYERQGILVEEIAIDRAERECLADADARARLRERRAEREAIIDREYQAEFGQPVQERYPGCSAEEATEIAEHACLKYSVVCRTGPFRTRCQLLCNSVLSGNGTIAPVPTPEPGWGIYGSQSGNFTDSGVLLACG